MQAPWKILNIELSQEIPSVTIPDSYRGITLVFCWQGIPLGDRELDAAELPLSASRVLNLAVKAIAPAVGSSIEAGFEGRLPVDRPALFSNAVPDFQKLTTLEQPLKAIAERWAQPMANQISVVVCTRNRSQQLHRCLRSLVKLDPSPLEILVVDNAPSSTATREVVSQFPNVKYILEPDPGLSIARNTGIRHSRGEIIAFTDDDLKVHPRWLLGLQLGFRDPRVMAVTGLMLPAELETPAQVTFYQNAHSSRWEYQPLTFDNKFFQVMQSKGVPVWRIGAGANMAFRSEVFNAIGNFNEILGAGAAGCSEDSEMWYRILAEGWQCRYEPTAVVFHYHRSQIEELQEQMYQYMRGHVTALLFQFERYRHWGNLRRIFIALPRYYLRRILRKYLKGDRSIEQTLKSEIAGSLAGIKYYRQHKRYLARSQQTQNLKFKHLN